MRPKASLRCAEGLFRIGGKGAQILREAIVAQQADLS